MEVVFVDMVALSIVICCELDVGSSSSTVDDLAPCTAV
jgi:hypothetical protein